MLCAEDSVRPGEKAESHAAVWMGQVRGDGGSEYGGSGGKRSRKHLDLEQTGLPMGLGVGREWKIIYLSAV